MKESNESSRFYGTMIRTDLRAYLYTGRCWLANNVQTVSHRCLPSYRDFDSTCINADCTHILYLAHLVRNASSRFFFFFFIFFFSKYRFPDRIDAVVIMRAIKLNSKRIHLFFSLLFFTIKCSVNSIRDRF